MIGGAGYSLNGCLFNSSSLIMKTYETLNCRRESFYNKLTSK